MRRAILAITGIAVGTPLLVALKMGAGGQVLAGSSANQPAATAPATTKPPAGKPPAGKKTTAPPKAPAAPKAVTKDGPTVDTDYGPVQIQVTVTGDKITAIKELQLTNSGARSDQINTNAVPKLRAQALSTNSANLDTVSGATVTSQAYAQSLQGALDAARG